LRGGSRWLSRGAGLVAGESHCVLNETPSFNVLPRHGKTVGCGQVDRHWHYSIVDVYLEASVATWIQLTHEIDGDQCGWFSGYVLIGETSDNIHLANNSLVEVPCRLVWPLSEAHVGSFCSGLLFEMNSPHISIQVMAHSAHTFDQHKEFERVLGSSNGRGVSFH
jgi:hypothetical protein